MKFLVGADPEVFVSHEGTIVPVVGHLGGTKKKPLVVTAGAVQEDNVLAEFNINPASSRDEFVGNIKTVMGQLREKLGVLDIEVRTSHMFAKSALLRAGKQALMFGCDPDYNAYTGEKNKAPSPRQELRTAGGHVHVGYDDPNPERNREIVKYMDVHLGLASLLLDDDSNRRSMYGAAGCYRDKPYGVEYRTLSNFWLQHTDLIKWVYDQTERAVNDEMKYDFERVRTAINTNSTLFAEQFIKQHGIVLP